MSKLKYKNWDNVPSHIPPAPGSEFIVQGGPFSLDWVFSFGKYRRPMRTLEQVIDEDPNYVLWCVHNVVGFILTPEAFVALAESSQQLGSDDEVHDAKDEPID